MPDALQADNILQGDLGDCWLLAALTCIADFPGHVKSLFRPSQWTAAGRYEVRLYDLTGGWQTVVVDDRIPCRPGSRWPLFSRVHRGGSWVCILEKALAKFCGSYERLDAGDEAWAYQVLTGVQTQLAYWKGGLWSNVLGGREWQQLSINVELQKAFFFLWRSRGMKACPTRLKQHAKTLLGLSPPLAPPEVFKQLAFFEQANCLISASIAGREERHRPDGLIECHAYSVLQLQKAHGNCMVKLRNPWGGDGCWNGAFSDGSPEWVEHPLLATDLQREGRKEGGTFWMRWEDFESIFNDIRVCPGCLQVPKQSHESGQVRGGLTCPLCSRSIARLWWMIDGDGSPYGWWTRLRDGDLCSTCRRAHRGLDAQRILGIDVFPSDQRIYNAEPPCPKPICRFGPACIRHDPHHFAECAHPWLAPYEVPEQAAELSTAWTEAAKEFLEQVSNLHSNNAVRYETRVPRRRRRPSIASVI